MVKGIKQNPTELIRSSAAQYPIFIAATGKGVIEEFTIKGFTMDDERIKSGGSVLSDQYFEEQLQRILDSDRNVLQFNETLAAHA